MLCGKKEIIIVAEKIKDNIAMQTMTEFKL